jgi:hypothetical protein
MLNIADIYEEKVFTPKDTFKVQTDKKIKQAEVDKKAFISSPSGPKEAEGVSQEVIDPKTAKKDNFYEPQKFSQNCEKTETEAINNFMNKSIFDKLYEDVMSDRANELETTDLDALGLPGEEGVGEEGGDEVTLTIDRETAQKLHDLLSTVLGGEEEGGSEEGGNEEGDLEGEEENSEDVGDDASEQEETLGEATDIQELKGKGESLQGKNNKVGDVTSRLTSKGGGDSKVTDETGNKDTGKHSLVQDTDTGNLKGKNNKVASKTSKVGEYLAGLK